MFSTFFLSLRFIDPRIKLQLLFVFLLILLSGASEALSIGAVVPLLLAFSNPSGSGNTRELIPYLSITTELSSLLIASIIFCVAILFAAFLRTYTLWYQCRLSAQIGTSLSSKAFARILNQPYSSFIEVNSSANIALITSYSLDAVQGFNSLLQLFASTVVALSISIAVLLIDLKLAVVIVLSFLLFYFTVSLKARQILSANSKIVSNLTRDEIQVLNESFGMIKEIIVASYQEFFIDLFKRCDEKLRLTQAQSQFLNSAPKFILEAIAIVVILLIAVSSILGGKDSSNLFASLGSIALASQRLLPSMQRIYGSWATIKAREKSVSRLLNIVSADQTYISGTSEYTQRLTTEINSFQTWEVKSLNFAHHNSNINVLTGLSISINLGDKVALIGKSGSGKSTFIDIFMGLHQTNCEIFVNNRRLETESFNSQIKSFQSLISHVPQKVYLLDKSIYENIILFSKAKDLKFDDVKNAAKLACAHEFISKLPNGYNTIVGEDGHFLSGGQRQRIAIARALCSKSQILVLDEATSALDPTTESLVFGNLSHALPNLTILAITHRHTILDKFNKVYKFDGGQAILLD